MAKVRRHPKLSIEVCKVHFYPQVAQENQLWPFTFFPRMQGRHLQKLKKPYYIYRLFNE